MLANPNIRSTVRPTVRPTSSALLNTENFVPRSGTTVDVNDFQSINITAGSSFLGAFSRPYFEVSIGDVFLIEAVIMEDSVPLYFQITNGGNSGSNGTSLSTANAGVGRGPISFLMIANGAGSLGTLRVAQTTTGQYPIHMTGLRLRKVK